MNNKIIVIFVLVILIIGGLFYFTQNPYTNQLPTPKPTTKTEADKITIQNFSFNPVTITIKKGTKITWTNEDTAPHNIKSDTLNSKNLDKGEKFEFTFKNKGTFDYICGIHPSMQGKIVVE